MHPRIKWTVEVMKDEFLAYLDVGNTVEEDRSLSFNVYRKPTHTNQYLNFDSNHHVGHKLSVVNTMNLRAETLITKEENIAIEKQLLADAFQKCKYPTWAIEHYEKKKNQEKNTPKEKEKEESAGFVIAPYIKSTSEKLAKIFRKYNIDTIHKPYNKMKGLVCSMKQPIHPLDRDGAIYDVVDKIHAPPPKSLYVGETDRPEKERGCEHRVISHADSKKCHSLTPFEVEEEQPPQPIPATTRRSQRTKARVNYNELSNTGTLIEIPQEEHQESTQEQSVRRSTRKKTTVDYKKMNAGPQFLTEGASEVSKHIALYDHEEGDISMRAVGYSQNNKHRGIKEAIEIRRRKPILNIQLAQNPDTNTKKTVFLPYIYDLLIDKPNQ